MTIAKGTNDDSAAGRPSVVVCHTVKGKGNPVKKDHTRKEGKKPKMG
jgi:transketolase